MQPCAGTVAAIFRQPSVFSNKISYRRSTRHRNLDFSFIGSCESSINNYSRNRTKSLTNSNNSWSTSGQQLHLQMEEQGVLTVVPQEIFKHIFGYLWPKDLLCGI